MSQPLLSDAEMLDTSTDRHHVTAPPNYSDRGYGMNSENIRTTPAREEIFLMNLAQQFRSLSAAM